MQVFRYFAWIVPTWCPIPFHIRGGNHCTLKIQPTLSKADTLGTKATVGFREVSALERVQVAWYPNLQIESWAFVQCKMTTWWTGCVSFSRPNGTQHSSYEFVYFIKTRDVPVIRLRYFQVCYKFVLTSDSGVRFKRFRTKMLKTKSVRCPA